MAYDGWLTYNGVELVNLSRTAQLAGELGIATVWQTPEETQWIEDALGGVDYSDITEAPWYDPGYPASMEFAGLVSLGFPGLDDSTLTSTPTEYITDGGHSGKPRSTTLAIVGSVAVIASTDRGAEFGKNWLNRVLRDTGARVFCSGADLRYFRYAGTDAIVPPVMHRRDVRMTRGTTVTRKRSVDCSVTWFVTFTLTAADPFEYSDEFPRVAELGSLTPVAPPGAPALVDSGDTVMIEYTCPVWDYSPIYDPLYPALVPPPVAPDYYPAGWDIFPGMTFDRFWARVAPVEPTSENVVPVITLTTDTQARMVRVSIWDSVSDPTDQCDPLFSAVVAYLPSGVDFVIDGEQKASYVWDGVSPAVRRADSLVYAPDANPVQWTTFNDPTNLLVTLDIFSDSTGYEGDGTIRAAVSFVAKSD